MRLGGSCSSHSPPPAACSACPQVPTRRLAAGAAASAQYSETLTSLRAGIAYEVKRDCCNVKGESVPFNEFLVSWAG